MIEDLAEDDDEDDDGSEEEEYETTSESVESTTTRFGRFMSPLAFSKISETLGIVHEASTQFIKLMLFDSLRPKNIVATARFISR